MNSKIEIKYLVNFLFYDSIFYEETSFNYHNFFEFHLLKALQALFKREKKLLCKNIRKSSKWKLILLFLCLHPQILKHHTCSTSLLIEFRYEWTYLKRSRGKSYDDECTWFMVKLLSKFLKQIFSLNYFVT